MVTAATIAEQYINALPAGHQEPVRQLRGIVLKNLPKGFEEIISNNMINYVVPHRLYPAGYHCDPKLPLPFASIASQKNFIAFHHMGIYSEPEILKWFVEEYPKHSKSKLDMGKSCIRFKKPDQIPYELIGELVKKINVKDWIKIYESNVKR